MISDVIITKDGLHNIETATLYMLCLLTVVCYLLAHSTQPYAEGASSALLTSQRNYTNGAEIYISNDTNIYITVLSNPT